jgi:hypothetical protein
MNRIFKLIPEEIEKLPIIFSSGNFNCYDSFESSLPGITIMINHGDAMLPFSIYSFYLLNANKHHMLIILSTFEISETIHIGENKEKAIILIKRKLLEKYSRFESSYSKKRELTKSITTLLKEKIK